MLGLIGRRRNWRPNIGMRSRTALVDLTVTGKDDSSWLLSVSSLDFRIVMTWQRKKTLRVMTAKTGVARKKTEELYKIHQKTRLGQKTK